MDELYDQYRKITFRKQMENDKRAWEAADLNKDKRLSVDEYAGFLHPHDFPHMSEIVLQRTAEEMDANGDGFITKEEYLSKHCTRVPLCIHTQHLPTHPHDDMLVYQGPTELK